MKISWTARRVIKKEVAVQTRGGAVEGKMQKGDEWERLSGRWREIKEGEKKNSLEEKKGDARERIRGRGEVSGGRTEAAG